MREEIRNPRMVCNSAMPCLAVKVCAICLFGNQNNVLIHPACMPKAYSVISFDLLLSMLQDDPPIKSQQYPSFALINNYPG